MIAFALALFALQAQQPPSSAPTTSARQVPAVEPAPPELEPYAGSLRDARAALIEASESARHDDAQRLCKQILAHRELAAQPESMRAEVAYAVGTAYGFAGELKSALEHLRRAQGLAGSSELGRDALYEAGTLLLLHAEELRKLVPEIAQKLGLPAAPQTGFAPQQNGAAPQIDALDVARRAYLDARTELAQRWRIEPGERDTRANLELLQRRLRELDELAKQREDEQQQQDKDPKQDKNQPPNKDQQKPDPNQKQDPQQSDAPEKDPKEKQDPQAQPDDKGEQPKPEDKPEDPSKEDSQAKPDAAKAREDMLMTPEEVQRLLDHLSAIDAQALQVQKALRERRKTPVKKDW